ELFCRSCESKLPVAPFSEVLVAELFELLTEVFRNGVEGCFLEGFAFPRRVRRHRVAQLRTAERGDLPPAARLDVGPESVEQDHRADGGHAPLSMRADVSILR